MSDLTDRLSQPLDRSRIKTRQGTGKQLSYLETHDVIRTANEIFGFGQWGHEVVELRQLNAAQIQKDGKEGWHVGYLCIVKLSVRDKTSLADEALAVPTSGVGYGDATEYRATAIVTAHELAAKEAESDALKRALKNYGDQFGLALYDKDAEKAGHLTDGAEKAPAAKKPASSPTGQFAVWEAEMASLGVENPAGWAKAATEASGGKDASTMAKLGSVLADLRVADEGLFPPIGSDVEKVSLAFGSAFGVLVDGPA